MYYTIGQRQGLGIGGRRGESGNPWYVADKDLDGNALIVVQGANHPRLLRRRLRAADLWWIDERAPRLPLSCQAKIRYRQPQRPCRVESVDAQTCEVTFDQAQRAITPGQSVVFYRGEACLGGGIIEAAFD
jgi:tRNA-specific 2-thiouridylase